MCENIQGIKSGIQLSRDVAGVIYLKLKEQVHPNDTLFWGGSRRSRVGYLKISADKTKLFA